MSSEVDELFGEGEGVPKPRIALALVLLLGGLALSVLGLACSTAPGGVLVLLSWLVVEKDVDRLESGYLPADHRGTLGVLRILARLGVVVVIVLTAVQAAFVCGLFYPDAWSRFMLWWLGVEAEPPA